LIPSDPPSLAKNHKDPPFHRTRAIRIFRKLYDAVRGNLRRLASQKLNDTIHHLLPPRYFSPRRSHLHPVLYNDCPRHALLPRRTFIDPGTQGYSFFANFFSDLGATRTPSGATNTLSMILFSSSLTIVGIGLAVFFVALTQFFRDPRFGPILPATGALLGVIAGLCFVGVAFTPWNLHLAAHNHFVMWAFRTFLGAVLIYGIAVIRERTLPKKFAFTFLTFAILLAAYVLLLTFGPSPTASDGLRIQVAGQKIIVYGSILTVLIQSLAANRLLKKRSGTEA
jgi:hypothetical membrane protein